MLRTNPDQHGSKRAAGLLAIAGVALFAAPVMAQTQAQTSAQRGGTLHVQRGQPAVTTAPAQRGAAAAPVPTAVRSGVRATFPEPVRPGQRRLLLPPAPELPPREIVEPPPPFVVLPRERRRQVIVVHSPYFPHHYPYHYQQHYPQHPAPHVYAPPAQLVPPAQVEPVEPEPLTGRELGDAYLHWDEPDLAITTYQDHLKENPGDVEAIRKLGLALIDTGRLQEGIATVALAYEKDPTLAQRPVPEDVFGIPGDLRRNLGRVSMHANRVDSASAWLTLAVLMQAEGRTNHAARMLTRAERAGLSEEVLDSMRSAVGTRTTRQAQAPRGT